MGNNNKMTENYVQKIWVKNVVILGWFSFRQVFVFRVLFFCFEYFSTILIGNNNKLTENLVQMVWMQKEVIMC